MKGLAVLGRGKAGVGMSSSLSCAHLGNPPPGGMYQNPLGCCVPGLSPRLQFLSLGKGRLLTDSPKRCATWRANPHFIPSGPPNIPWIHKSSRCQSPAQPHATPTLNIYRGPTICQVPCQGLREQGELDPVLAAVGTPGHATIPQTQPTHSCLPSTSQAYLP